MLLCTRIRCFLEKKIRFLPNKQTKSQKSENEASLPGVVPCNLGGKGKSGDIEVFCHHISSLNWHCIVTTCLTDNQAFSISMSPV